MRVLVCLKQVPRLEEVRFDRANRIVREDVTSVCNPLDVRALGHALALAGDDGEVTAVTMGPPGAREVLEEAIRCGADRAVHLTDRRFKGADTLATARALSEVVRSEKPDLVLFGRGTLDGATAQLGQQVAELADLAQITEAVGLERDGDRLRVERETECGRQHWQVPLPAAVTVARGPSAEPGRSHVDGFDVTEVGAEDLGGAPTFYGTRGSPTFVREVRVHESQPRRESVTTAEEAADRVVELLTTEGDDEPAPQRRAEPSRDVWVLCEHDGEALDPVTFEGLACARSMADDLDARVSAVLVGATEGGVADELAEGGADRVLHLRNPALATYSTDGHTDALTGALRAEEPYVLVAPFTADGRDHVPRVAARLGLGLTGDVTGVEVETGDKPRVGWIKPAWAGTADALVISRTTPTVATLRPGAYEPLRSREGASVPVDVLDVEVTEATERPRLVDDVREVGDCRLDRARLVLCLGADVPADTATEIAKWAATCGAGVGGTAEAVRAGLVPPQWELSVVKRSIAPHVCVALGRHAAQDLAPVRGARHLVTVDPDVNAPGHEQADLQLVTDVAELVTALRERT